MTPGDEQRELLKTEEAAARLGMTPRTLEKWRHRGVGPAFVRLSARAVRYRAQDLADWLAGRRVEVTT